MPRTYVERRAPFTPPALGTLSAGAAIVDVTPALGLPMAGYSTQGRIASGVVGRLFARALFLEDADGERVALVTLDLMSASRYLLEAVASRTASFGIGTDRLVLAGTHTHTGPGWFYGNSLYDDFACAEAGFDEGFASWVAARIAGAVERAGRSARPARVGVGMRPCWGVSRNRSLAAFQANPSAPSWNDAPFPGADAPAGLSPDQRAVDPRVRVLAAFDRATGAPTIGGSEESRTILYRSGLVREGMRGNDFAPGDPQYPKVKALGPGMDVLRAVLGLTASPVFPLHVVRIGSLLIATVPGEPTGHAAYAIEQALESATGATSAWVVGYAGDYSGYLTTPEEYDAQHYEGASTIFGRPTVPHLTARLVALATGTPAGPPAVGPIGFHVGRRRARFVAADCCGPSDPATTASRAGDRISVRWTMAPNSNVLFASGFIVRVERRDALGSWVPLEHMGREFDDVHHAIGIHRIDPTTWSAEFTLPETLGISDPLRVRGAPRDQFPGFVVVL